MDASADLAITGTALLDGELRPATVLVREGRVAGVRPPDPAVDAAERVVLADDEVLLPGLVDTHVHVNEPGRTEWEGFATATRAAAAGGVTTLVDMPLNSHPADRRRRRARGQARGRRRAVPRRRRLLGRRRARQRSGGLAPLHDAGRLRLQVLPRRHRAWRVPAADRGRARPGARRGRRVRRAADRARRGRRPCWPARPRAPGRRTRDFLASRPPRPRTRRSPSCSTRRPGTARGCTCVHLSAPTRCPRCAAARAGGRPGHRRDLPALPDPHRRGDPRRRAPSSSAARRSATRANRDALWQALADGRHRLRGLRPLPRDGRPEGLDAGDFGAAWGGIASVQLGLPVGVDRGARARGRRWTTWSAGCPPHRPPWSASPARARSPPGNDADLVVFAPDETFRGRPGAAAAPQPGHAVRRAGAGRRGPRRLAAAGRRVVSDGEPVRRTRSDGC